MHVPLQSVVMALWRLLLGRSPYAAAFVKIDDDTWVVNASMLMLTVASSLRPRSSGLVGFWPDFAGKFKSLLTARSGVRSILPH